MRDVTTERNGRGVSNPGSIEPARDDDGLSARPLALAGLGCLLAIGVAGVLVVAWRTFNPIRGC